MAKDISTLIPKDSNEGSTPAGRLTHTEWNDLVAAVIENQKAVNGAIKGIIYKGGPDNGGQLFNEIDERGYLKMSPADPQGDITMNVTAEPAKYIAKGAECKVSFTISSKTPDGKSSQNPCTVRYYIKNTDNPAVEKTLVGTGTIYDYTYGNAMGYTKSLTFDFGNIPGSALAIGDFDNTLTIEVNNGMGRIYTQMFTVRVIDLSLEVFRFSENSVYSETNKPVLEAIVSNIDGRVNAKVDGKTILTNGIPNGANIATVFDDADFNKVNLHGVHTLEVWATVTKDYLKENEDGTSSIEQILITTDTLKYTYIYGTSDAKPIVMANIANKNPEEYTNFNVGYIAYKYNDTNNTVKDNIVVELYEYKGTNDDGTYIIDRKRRLDSIPQEVSFDAITKSTTGYVTFSLFPKTITLDNGNKETINLRGDFVIVIRVGEGENAYEYFDLITVKESTTKLVENTGYAVKLVSSGRSNGEPESTLRTWSSVGTDSTTSPTTAEMIFNDSVEFIDTGSGWIYDGIKYDINDKDDKGSMALHLRKGASCTLNYKPFAKNPTYLSENNAGQNTGLTISIEFATRNSLNQNAKVISCVSTDNNGKLRGFEILANKALLYCNKFNMFADFKEDTRIKLDIVIEGRKIAYDYNTVTGTGKDGDEIIETGNKTDYEALAIIYVDGVYQALELIPEGTSFMQSGGGVPIEFGSEDCDLDIYNIRIYNTALNPIQIVQNYAFDTPNVKEKIAIAARNTDVLTPVTKTPNKPNINIEGLRRARPDLPFFYVEMDTNADPTETLPKDKSAWKLMKMTQFKNPANNESLLEAAPSFEIAYGVMRNQGTSSMTYPWPWRNWDWKTKDDEFPQGKGKYSIPTIANPVHSDIKYWPLYKGMYDIAADGSGALKKLTFKKDYASSEMCNNAITSEYFTDMAIGIGDAIPEVLSLAQRATHSIESPTQYRLTLKAVPCFMFRTYADTNKDGSAGKGYEALGMMNLIPNKNECVHLGFDKEWTWETNSSQSWELKDNYPEWYWVKKIKGIQRTNDTTFENDVKKLYEARYPKDSTVKWETGAESDFGMLYDDQEKLSYNEAQALYKEQADLVAFHNWLVDCNRQVAIDYKEEHGDWRELTVEEKSYSWNVDKDGNVNHYDTPEYRINKFANEARDHMIIEQFALYYIWRETFWAYDSGFKNLQIYTMGPRPDNPGGPKQWGCMVRDADTTLGIQNQGRIEFPPYLEDTDYYIQNEGEEKTFFFDALKECYDEKDITRLGGKHVLNGQLGSLWINLRDAFGGDIAKVYRKLVERSSKTNWNSSKAIKRFRDHQEKWCESLYNFGMRQYFGGSPFSAWRTSGLGDKKNSRAAWLDKAFYYRNSKYKALGADDFAAFRAGCYETPQFASGNTHSETVNMKLYQPMWLCLNANTQDNTEVLVHRRITDVDNYIQVPVNDEGFGFPVGFNSAVSWQYGTTNMIEIGDLARVCKVFEIQSWNFPKLRKLELGHEPERDDTTYLEFITDAATNERLEVPISNNSLAKLPLDTLTQLQLLDITNHNALPAEIDAHYCTQLQELYAQGCYNTTTIKLPNTTTLHTIYLPNTMGSINLDGLSGITKFKLEQPSINADGTVKPYTISNLKIVNCGKKGSYMSKESYNIVMQVLDSLCNAYDPEENPKPCEVSNIYWTGVKANDLERLLEINASISGEITITGTLTNALKIKLVAAYGTIDNPDNPLYIKYTPEEIDSIRLPKKQYLHELGKTYQLSEYLSVTPSHANTYDRAEWTFSGGSTTCSFGKLNKNTGEFVRNTTVDTMQTPVKVNVKVYQIPDADGNARDIFEASMDLYFYERLAKPGDIVYSDGTYSDEIDKTKNAVGVCFYVDPDNPDNRLMCALQPVAISGIGEYIPWGCYWGGSHINAEGETYGYYGTSPNLNIGDTGYDCYNIAAIPDVTLTGPADRADATGMDKTIYYSDDIYRDPEDAKNGYFMKFDKITFFGDIGWKGATKTVKVDGLSLPDGKTMLTINSGERVPSGYYNTLAIIEHRNKLLDEYRNASGENTFIRPYTTEDYTELYTLGTLMSEAKKWNYEERVNTVADTYGDSLYYGAASACFAYEPSGSGLIDKFKKHKWFLPASGDVVRILYYCYQSYKFEEVNGNIIGKVADEPVNSEYGSSYSEPANAFANAIREGKLNLSGLYTNGSNSISTSTETGRDEYITINSATGKWAKNHTKTSGAFVRPVCAF